ncbi:MAG: MFS transporter [Alphaproteobacteria bacterium]|nr:MFS transporter [Alphaproteobacteria bacterium]
MQATLRNITALLLATALFLSGNGLQGTLVPVRANIEGFSDAIVAILGSAYFLGFMLGCVAAPYLLQRVGHIRTFATFAAVTGIAALLHPILPYEWAWMVLRGSVGLAAAAQFTVIESWFHHQATNENRGRVISIYVVVNLGALIFGQYLFAMGAPETNERFSYVAMLILASTVPVALTLLPQPLALTAPNLRIAKLYRASPVGFMGNIAVGLANGPFWALAPLYVTALGFAKNEIAMFMGITIAGAAIAQWPLGRLSDAIDRRIVVAGAAGMAVVAGAILVYAALAGTRGDAFTLGLTYAGGLMFGAFAFPIGSLCAAHLNDHVEKGDTTETAGAILFIYGAAAIVGPLIASGVIALFGMWTLFALTAFVHTGFLVFTLIRISAREAPPTREAYQPIPESGAGLPRLAQSTPIPVPEPPAQEAVLVDHEQSDDGEIDKQAQNVLKHGGDRAAAEGGIKAEAGENPGQDEADTGGGAAGRENRERYG